MKRLFSVLLFLSIVVGCYPQNKVRGELRTEENGFQWYCYGGKEAYSKDGVKLFPNVNASNIRYVLSLKGAEQDIENGCFLVELSKEETILWDGKSSKMKVYNLYTTYGKLIKEGVLYVNQRLSVGGYGGKEKYYYTIIGTPPLFPMKDNQIRMTASIINDDGVPILQNFSSIKGILFYNEKPEKRIGFWGTTESGNTFIITDNGGSLELQGSWEFSFDDDIVYAQSDENKQQKLYSKDWIYLGELEKSEGAFRLIKKDGYVGVINKEGYWVIKQEYSKIDFLPSPNKMYFVVNKNKMCGLFDADGKEIIPTSRGYSSIDYDSSKGTFAVAKPRYTGVCDAQGNEISMTKLPPTVNDIKAEGGYASAVEMMNGSIKYYKVSKGGKYGLTSSEGKVIVPVEMEALESAGTGYLRFKIGSFWGVMNYAGKIIIPTDRGYTKIGDYVSFTKRFPYEMAGYKGECNNLGVQVSKIKVNTPQQNVASNPTSSSSSNKKEVYEFDYSYDASSDIHTCSMKEAETLFYGKETAFEYVSRFFKIEVFGTKNCRIYLLLADNNEDNTIAFWGNTFTGKKREDCSLSISLSNGENIKMSGCLIEDKRKQDYKGNPDIGGIGIYLGFPNTNSTGRAFTNNKEANDYLLEQCSKYDIRSISYNGRTFDMNEVQTAPTINAMITKIRSMIDSQK